LRNLRTSFTWLPLAAVLCLFMAAPALADTLYSNGPINGTLGFYVFQGGCQVSDSFTPGGASNLTGAQIGVWIIPPQTPTSVDWSIGTTPFGSDISSGTASILSNTLTGGLGAGYYPLAEDDFALSGTLAAGTYYLTLGNFASGYWDQNSGPSAAYYTGGGQLPSESFQLYGSLDGAVTPEPASLVLLSSGILIFAGFMRKFTS